MLQNTSSSEESLSDELSVETFLAVFTTGAAFLLRLAAFAVFCNNFINLNWYI